MEVNCSIFYTLSWSQSLCPNRFCVNDEFGNEIHFHQNECRLICLVLCSIGNFSTACVTARPLCLVVLFNGKLLNGMFDGPTELYLVFLSHWKLLNGMCDVPTVVFSYLVPFETSERPFWRFERLIKLSCSVETSRRSARLYLVILFNGKFLNGLYNGPTVVLNFLVLWKTSERYVWRSDRCF